MNYRWKLLKEIQLRHSSCGTDVSINEIWKKKKKNVETRKTT